MIDWPVVVGGLMVAFLIIYSLTGGADFGGGVWDLLARGPRAEDQRTLIKNEIGPIWEANHVWLIVLIVILFADFPKVFSLMANALHIPLTLMLFGVVFRGSAFVFHAYDRQQRKRRWSFIFASASAVTPIMLGICVGGMSSGKIQIDPLGRLESGFWSGWVGLFPFLTGLFTLALFAYLAAVYLACQAKEALQEDFRKRALISAVIVGILAFACLISASTGAPRIYAALTTSPWSLPLNVAAGLCAAGSLWLLWRRKYGPARIITAGQVSLVILGWAFAMYPYLIYPAYTVQQAAAPPPLPALTFWVLACGSVVLVPSFLYLYKIFAWKSEEASQHSL
ncbi:MAG: cytochrome d ubiquinol oxidase subunit II [Acidobacteriota bacterium]|nr:cytochrome d ubiquinol oxidase subunit II [Acidobacteriota bacterium]